MPGQGSVFIKDVSGNTVLLSTSGGLLINQAPYPCYNAFATNSSILPGTSGHQIVMFMASGTSAVKIRSLFITPTPENAVASGQAVKFDLCRIASSSGGGSGLIVTSLDPRDPASGVNLTLQQVCLATLSGVQSQTISGVFDSFITSSLGLPAPNSGAVHPGQTWDMLNAAQTTNVFSQSPLGEEKPIVVTSGFGFSLHQTTGAGYTQVGSGSLNIVLTYSVEPS